MRSYKSNTIELMRIKPIPEELRKRKWYLLRSFDATDFDNEIPFEEQPGEPILAHVEIPGFDEFVLVDGTTDENIEGEFVLIPKSIIDIVEEEMPLEHDVSKASYNSVRGSAKPIVTNRLSEFFGVLQDFVKSWRQS